MPNLDPSREDARRQADRFTPLGPHVPDLADLVPDFGRLLEISLAAIMSIPLEPLRDDIDEIIDGEIATDGPGPSRPPRDTPERAAEVEVRLGRRMACLAHWRALGINEMLPALAAARDLSIAEHRRKKAEKAAQEEAAAPAPT